MSDTAVKLVSELRKLQNQRQKRVFIGFDAFIDLVVRPVEKGSSANVEKYFNKMECFGQYLAGKAGLNSSVELDLIMRKPGGNTPNVAGSLSRLGVSCDCLAPFGDSSIDEIFAPLRQSCNLISTGDPGLSIALEFTNGKVMLALNQDVNSLDWRRIRSVIEPRLLAERVNLADMLCLLNWSEVPKCTDIILGLKKEILSSVAGPKTILIDLSDCSRRSRQDLLEILEIIASLSEHGRVILGLNQNESQIVCAALDIDQEKKGSEKAGQLREKLKLHWVVFHNRRRSILATKESIFNFRTKMTGEPVLQTGAGDHFNAGLCLGYLNGFEPRLCLALASINSGYYVEKGESANIDELIAYIEAMEVHNE